MEEEETSEISIERPHRLSKIREDKKPRLIIGKFSFHQWKSTYYRIPLTLAGTNYGIPQDFPREIDEIRKGLISNERRKEGGARYKTCLQQTLHQWSKIQNN